MVIVGPGRNFTGTIDIGCVDNKVYLRGTWTRKMDVEKIISISDKQITGRVFYLHKQLDVLIWISH